MNTSYEYKGRKWTTTKCIKNEREYIEKNEENKRERKISIWIERTKGKSKLALDERTQKEKMSLTKLCVAI